MQSQFAITVLFKNKLNCCLRNWGRCHAADQSRHFSPRDLSCTQVLLLPQFSSETILSQSFQILRLRKNKGLISSLYLQFLHVHLIARVSFTDISVPFITLSCSLFSHFLSPALIISVQWLYFSLIHSLSLLLPSPFHSYGA